MYTMTLKISGELKKRLDKWSERSNLPPEYLPIDLLNEYFDDADDADRLEALIRSGDIGTVPADLVHKEHVDFAVLGS